MLQNKKLENEFFSFILNKKREKEDKTRPKNDFYPTMDRKDSLTIPNKQIRTDSKTHLKTLMKKTKEIFDKKKLY
jgi:hypothetical protein